ncbi:MAG: hypothetical protein JWM10_3589, partial [Myxococcaceae bacterium]|nr:hypothetical protein [Myxococcaceae bacterium]
MLKLGRVAWSFVCVIATGCSPIAPLSPFDAAPVASPDVAPDVASDGPASDAVSDDATAADAVADGGGCRTRADCAG